MRIEKDITMANSLLIITKLINLARFRLAIMGNSFIMNKILLLSISLLLSMSSFSQSQSGIASVNFGDTIHIDDVSIEFVELLTDSRCPKSVNCIRAGEAKVLVAVYRNGKFSHEKKLVFHASGLVNQEQTQLFNSEYLNIQGLALYPYPSGIGKIVDEKYYLDLKVN